MIIFYKYARFLTDKLTKLFYSVMRGFKRQTVKKGEEILAAKSKNKSSVAEHSTNYHRYPNVLAVRDTGDSELVNSLVKANPGGDYDPADLDTINKNIVTSNSFMEEAILNKLISINRSNKGMPIPIELIYRDIYYPNRIINMIIKNNLEFLNRNKIEIKYS